MVLDQPCCAFEPHVLVVYPSYFDGKKIDLTGQVLLVKNDAKFNHNTKIMGGRPLKNYHDQHSSRPLAV